PTTYDIPTIKATGYITGINTTALDKKILNALK
ncbi:PTS galactitol transporter subunit IIB, partial [Clostridioides difficile]